MTNPLFSPPLKPPTPSPPRLTSLRSTPFRCVYPTGKSRSSTRLFLDAPLIPGTQLTLPATEHAHLRARRLQPGATVTLFNSHGRLATAVIHPDHSVTVLSAVSSTPHTCVIHAVVAFPKAPQRADCIVEKLTEIGAHRISFCQSARVIPKAPPHARLQRWERIAVAASKQSLRADIPSVEYLDHFSTVLDVVRDAQLALLLSPNGVPLLSKQCLQRFDRSMNVVVLAGPEGGFTEEEESSFIAAGATPVTLGINRLRVETAIITATAVISQLAHGTLL